MTERDPYESRHVRRGIRQFLSGKLIQAVASVIVMLIMVRVMDVGQYALYITALSLAIFLGTISILGLDRVLTRYVPEGRIKATPTQLIRFISRIRYVRLLSVGCVTLVVGLGWPYLAPRLQLPSAGLTLPVLLFSAVHAFDQFQRIVLQSLMLQADLRNATTLTWMLRLTFLLGIVFAGTPLTAERAVWITLISEAAGWLWMVLTTAKHYVALRRSPAGDGQSEVVWPGDARAILRFGWDNYLMGQASFPSQARVQQLLVAAFFSPPIVAAFGFFRNLSEQLRSYLPLQLMKNLAEPVMFGRYAQTQDFSHLNAMTSALLKVNMLLIAPLAAWLFVAAEPAIGILTGGKFVDEIWVLAVLIASQVSSSQVTLLVIAANATGTSRRLPVATVTASVFTVLLLWTQISTMGILAVVLSDLIFGLVTIGITAYGMTRVGYRYNFDALALVRMTMFAVMVAGLAIFARQFWPDLGGLFGSLSVGIAMAAIYWVLNIAWSPFREDERELLSKVFGRIRSAS
jgi:O-antigen/teichoic acid export membrane protein